MRGHPLTAIRTFSLLRIYQRVADLRAKCTTCSHSASDRGVDFPNVGTGWKIPCPIRCPVLTVELEAAGDLFSQALTSSNGTHLGPIFL